MTAEPVETSAANARCRTGRCRRARAHLHHAAPAAAGAAAAAAQAAGAELHRAALARRILAAALLLDQLSVARHRRRPCVRRTGRCDQPSRRRAAGVLADLPRPDLERDHPVHDLGRDWRLARGDGLPPRRQALLGRCRQGDHRARRAPPRLQPRCSSRSRKASASARSWPATRASGRTSSRC